MGVLEALELLNQLVDDSDPDIALPNSGMCSDGNALGCLTDPHLSPLSSVHAFQTAERIREKHPDKEWLQLTGLIHDLGKVPPNV